MSQAVDRQALAIAIQTGRPVLLKGYPGIGKSSWITAVAEATGRHLEVVIGSLRDPVDFGGLPIARPGGGVQLAAMPWVERIKDKAMAGQASILFLDEISTAPPSVQAALLRVVLERVVGDEKLPDDLWIIAAANPPEVAAAGFELSAPLANRFAHFTWDYDADEWVAGMLGGWPEPTVPTLPPNWESYIPRGRQIVAGFIHHRRHLLFQIPKDPARMGEAWPSPRTWEMAAVFLGAAISLGLWRNKDLVVALVRSCVGEPAAVEFASWLASADLPDPKKLLEDPDNFEIPERGDVLLVTVAAAVDLAISSEENKRRYWNAVWRLLERVAEAGFRDIATAAARPLERAYDINLDIPVKALNAIGRVTDLAKPFITREPAAV